MKEAGVWIMGLAMIVLSVIGLSLASAAVDTTMYWVGLLIFVFGVVFVFHLIHQHTGVSEGRHDRA